MKQKIQKHTNEFARNFTQTFISFQRTEPFNPSHDSCKSLKQKITTISGKRGIWGILRHFYDESIFGSWKQHRYHLLYLFSLLGNRQKHLCTALKKLRSITSIRDTSFVYDTKAMYEVNQNRFLNAVCRIETELSPIQLLLECKRIEKEMGRQKTFRQCDYVQFQNQNGSSCY